MRKSKALSCITVTALLTLLPLAPPARANELTFPLTVDYALLGAALTRQLHASDDGLLWGSRQGCDALALHEVQVAPAPTAGRVRITARGDAHVGLGFLRFCLFPLRWDGYLETLATPRVGDDWRLRFVDLDSRLYDAEWKRAGIATRLWDLVKGRVEDDVGEFAFDLGPPMDEVRALLRASLTSERAAPLLRALTTLRPIETRVEEEGVKTLVTMNVPLNVPGEAAPPESELSPTELASWQSTLESWDAFVVFVVKDLGALDVDPASRDRLLDVLLESRQRLVEVVATGPIPGVAPVRLLFLDTWESLRAAVHDAAVRGALHDRALRYLTFLTAGDALAALDAAGPSFGVEISSDGLRRLARVLEPDVSGDPLAYSDQPDPALRGLFRFHEPPASPVETPATAEPTSWLGPSAAWAEVEPGADLGALARILDRAVPTVDTFPAYRDNVARLLELVSARSAEDNGVDAPFRDLYHHLVPATAWQESCWRQFVADGEQVKPLVSRTGDVGIMQVNRRVWRGFFDLRKLESDVAYNAGAGAEILAQFLTRYGVREASDDLDNAARATYSAYNGGPSAYRRYRMRSTPRVQRAIDRSFWTKYQTMVRGRALDLVLCVERWGHPDEHAMEGHAPADRS